MAKRIKIYFPDGENEMEIFDDQLENYLAKGFKKDKKEDMPDKKEMKKMNAMKKMKEGKYHDTKPGSLEEAVMSALSYKA